MGQQLWTSSITGYRRIGTRLHEIRALFEVGITAKAILEPLKSCPAFAEALEMKTILGRRDFDVAGVKESENGDFLGFVKKNKLNHGLVRDCLEKLAPENLISDSTPIPDLFLALRNKDFVLVIVSTKIAGIITRADLNKPPARIFLFSIVSMLEMHLTFWIREEYKNESWKGSLSKTRLKKTQDFFKERKRRNQEVDLLECTQFSDKRDLLLKSERLLNLFEIESKTQGKEFFKQAEDLRNSLAHSQKDLSEGSDWNALIDVVAWIEKLLALSDAEIEKHARAISENFSEALLQ